MTEGGSGVRAVEYLYGTKVEWPDDGPEIREVVLFRITRKTARRVYYIRQERRSGHVDIGYVDRETLDRDGQVSRRSGRWWEDDRRLHATREGAEADLGIGQYAPELPDLAKLKQDMTSAHPDRGGTAEDFIRARKQYKQAAGRAATR